MTRASATTFVVLALSLASTAVAATSPQPARIQAAALGDEGQLYQMLAGTFGELFPEDPSQLTESPVLALDVVGPDGTHERTLVPGSEGPEIEGAASLIFEDASRQLYSVWESKKTPVVSRLLLASFGTDGWSAPIEISGDISPLKHDLRVLITRDRFSLRDSTGKRESRSRTAIHVVWREEETGRIGIYYTPVILEAGRYIGWNPVVELGSVDPNAPEVAPQTAPLKTLGAPELIAGQDLHSAIVGFLSPVSGHVITLEVRLLPGEVSVLADDIRADIIEIGVRDRDKLESLATKFRNETLEIGGRLNRGILEYFADQVSASLLDLSEAANDRPIESIADDIRADIIEIGAHLLGGPGPSTPHAKMMEVAPSGPEEGSSQNGAKVNHLMRLRVVSDLTQPPLDDVPARLFLSEDGERVLVGWIDRGKVFYTETLEEATPDGETWSAVKHMTLTERFDVTDAAAVLESRVKRQR